jgi:hypothetical protein
VATAAAGFGPTAGAINADVGAAGLVAGAAAAGTTGFAEVIVGFGLTIGPTVICSGVLPFKFPAGDGPAARVGIASMAGLVRGSGDGRGSGTVSGGNGTTFGAGSSIMIEAAGS